MVTMNAEELALWQRVKSYSLDDPTAVRSFAGRLADEHGWTLRFAKLAIEEYRRFVFLAVAAGHSVSPSETVDEVWHLHLLYSRAYWDDFCPNVLLRPLHHFPSTGTPADDAKHVDWYARTREGYVKYFGPPPDDIWPSPEDRARTRVTPRHVDAELVWIVPKPRFLRHRRWIAAILLLGLAAGCAGQTPWPFDLRGPEFLVLFGVLIEVLVVITAVVAVRMRRTDPPEEPLPELTDEETAYLTGHSHRVLGTIITRLTRDDYLRVDPIAKRLVAGKLLPLDAPELDQEIVDQLQAGRSLIRVAREIRPQTAPIRERLVKLGLLVSDEANWWGRMIPLLLTLGVLGIGVTKIAVGVNLHRPVGYLIAMVVGLTVYLIAMCLPAHGTWFGNSFRSKLVRDHSKLKKYATELSGGNRLPLALALFGPAVLYKTEFEDLRKQLVPQSGGSTSGCSASFGGGGGGCGGGGGGGCGGCGCGG